MQGWTRPVGPENERTYWVRRVIVLGVGLLVLALVVGAVVKACSPAPQAAVTPAPGASAPAVSTRSATPASIADHSVRPTPGPSETTPPPSTAPSESAPATPTPTSTEPTPAAACDAAQMRVTLVGTRRVESPSSQRLSLSVINGSAVPCTLTISEHTFLLEITSGPQKVWTTAECPAWLPPTSVVLLPEKAYAWDVTWPTRRSSGKCTLASETLPSGTYVAQATLAGAQPAKLVMELHT